MVRLRRANADDLAPMMELVRSAPSAAQWSRSHFEKLLAPESGSARFTLVAEECGAPQHGGNQKAFQDRGHGGSRGTEELADVAAGESASRITEVTSGPLVGFLAAHETAGEWEIENVVVSAHARRRGLGSKLLSEFLHHARSTGGKEVFLEVRESNTAARALYEKWAFSEAGRRKQYYQGPLEDALILKLSLLR